MAVSKIGDYIKHRQAGLDPTAAGLAAGYSLAGLSVTISRLEVREDVRKALRSKKGVRPLASPDTKRQYRSVADEPKHGDGPLDPWKLKDKYATPLDLLLDVMNNAKAPGGLRIQCAKDAMPYIHARKEGTKGEDKKSKGKQASENKSPFTTPAAPSIRRVA